MNQLNNLPMMEELLVSSNAVLTPQHLVCIIFSFSVCLTFSFFSCRMQNKDVTIAIDEKNNEKVVKNLPPPLRRWKSYPNTQNVSNRGSRPKKWSKDQSDVLQIHEEPLPTLSEDEEAVGIITMEDVIEELLQVSGRQWLNFYSDC
jgi:hypothetical protein